MPIPRQIFQAWLQAKAGIPEPMAAAMNTWKQLNPGYIHHVFDEDAVRDFFRQHFEPEYLEGYDLIVAPAFKTDFWRYCVLYKFGGIYADSKMILLRSLDTVLRPEDDMVVFVDEVDSIQIACLAFTPGHPVLEGVIKAILRHVKERNKTEHVLSFTGPFLFAKILSLYLGISALTTGRGPNFQLLQYGQFGVTPKTHFYDSAGEPFIKLQYETYKQSDCREWNHYPVLWYSNIIFKDRLAHPALHELPYLKEPPHWLKNN
jgi:mannosyltransferase OCH1-like enzyme